jgi:hypothetical protein
MGTGRPGVPAATTREEGGMFIRIFRPSEDKEILVSVNSIWKIEVVYTGRKERFRMSLERGLKDPNASRTYTIFIGNDSVVLPANPDDPVVKEIEKIYNDAVKG